jgi:di/tricarboxylate transporter
MIAIVGKSSAIFVVFSAYAPTQFQSYGITITEILKQMKTMRRTLPNQWLVLQTCDDCK